jgi:hypothetical protein
MWKNGKPLVSGNWHRERGAEEAGEAGEAEGAGEAGEAEGAERKEAFR